MQGLCYAGNVYQLCGCCIDVYQIVVVYQLGLLESVGVEAIEDSDKAAGLVCPPYARPADRIRDRGDTGGGGVMFCSHAAFPA